LAHTSVSLDGPQCSFSCGEEGMMRVFEQFARNFYRRHCHAYDSS
jgi:hypothetical protein